MHLAQTFCLLTNIDRPLFSDSSGIGSVPMVTTTIQNQERRRKFEKISGGERKDRLSLFSLPARFKPPVSGNDVQLPPQVEAGFLPAVQVIPEVIHGSRDCSPLQEVIQLAGVTGEVVGLIAVLGIPDVGELAAPSSSNQGVSPPRIEGSGGEGGLEMSMVVAHLGIDGISQRPLRSPGHPVHQVPALSVIGNRDAGQGEEGGEKIHQVHEAGDPDSTSGRQIRGRSDHQRDVDQALVGNLALLEEFLLAHEIAVVGGENSKKECS